MQLTHVNMTLKGYFDVLIPYSDSPCKYDNDKQEQLLSKGTYNSRTNYEVLILNSQLISLHLYDICLKHVQREQQGNPRNLNGCQIMSLLL